MTIESDWRSMMEIRVGKLELQTGLNTQSLDGLTAITSGMDAKLDKLIERNTFQDGGSSVRAGIIKALIAFATAGFSGGLIVEIFNWFTGRPHP